MQNKIFLSLLLLFVCYCPQIASAQEVSDTIAAQESIWPDQSTKTLTANRRVWPLFGVKKLGANKNMEWQIQPLFFFISPNLGLKKHWKSYKNGLSIASLHRVNYPSIYLNLFSREGAGGVLPKDSKIPPMLSIKNELLLGFNSKENVITLRAGIALAFKLSGAEKKFPDLDFPFLYNRTLAFNHSPNIYMGINYNRDFLPKWNIEADFAAFSVGNENRDFVHESRLVFLWKKSDKLGLKAGAAAAYGNYPFGSVFRAIPVFDIIFAWNGKRKKSLK